ncbi:MAG: hypothetical protein HQL38_04005, partial [Alphaproteobacteria bacterium]|nr:hypothetical protein [Alphaproteobacteria bacterium]
TGPVAASRVIAVSTAVVGALVGDWAYRKHQVRHGLSREVADRVTPR